MKNRREFLTEGVVLGGAVLGVSLLGSGVPLNQTDKYKSDSIKEYMDSMAKNVLFEPPDVEKVKFAVESHPHVEYAGAHYDYDISTLTTHASFKMQNGNIKTITATITREGVTL